MIIFSSDSLSNEYYDRHTELPPVFEDRKAGTVAADEEKWPADIPGCQITPRRQRADMISNCPNEDRHPGMYSREDMQKQRD